MSKFGDYKEEGIITEVTKVDDGFSIMSGAIGFFLSKKNIGDAVPEVDDKLVLHTYAGSSIRGVDINDKPLYYFSDADYEALPEYFQKRIDRFRTNNPNFRIDYEPYELFCCKEAIKIADACKVEEFAEMSYDEQMAFADIDDGHSGNTFGCAKSLAYNYLKDPAIIEKMHGALAPLVGSKEYGEIPNQN